MTMNGKTALALLLGQVVFLLLVMHCLLVLAFAVRAGVQQGLVGTYGGTVNGGFWVGHLGIELWGNPGTFDGIHDI